jgi:transcriptional regulator with XRE-family HTH domain
MNLSKTIEDNFNNKKLREIRLKKNLSINEVAEKTGIPSAKIQRYEAGTTKKVDLETIKKLADYYGVDYGILYGWSSFPLFTSISGLIFAYTLGVQTIVNGLGIGFFLGLLGIKGVEKYFEKSRKVNAFENLYDKLTKEEKNEFNGLKTVVEMSLHSKEVLTDEELKENEALLMSCYYLHKLKKESNKKNSIKIEDINYLEELEKKGE